jgi:hypothetical protein
MKKINRNKIFAPQTLPLTPENLLSLRCNAVILAILLNE